MPPRYSREKICKIIIDRIIYTAEASCESNKMEEKSCQHFFLQFKGSNGIGLNTRSNQDICIRTWSWYKWLTDTVRLILQIYSNICLMSNGRRIRAVPHYRLKKRLTSLLLRFKGAAAAVSWTSNRIWYFSRRVDDMI